MTRTIAFLGPEGTFASEAAELVAPDADRQALPTVPHVIRQVAERRADLGVVPIENSIEGSVTLTLDVLAFDGHDVCIRGEVALPVSMNLVGHAGTELGAIKEVRSHAVALAQSRNWLEANLPDVEVTVTTSTAAAVAEVAGADPSVAALGTRHAAGRYGLEVLASDVHDFDGNATRFVVLGTSMHPATGADKTSLVVLFGRDRPGQLMRVLDEFAMRGINLTKIESRPTKRKLGDYAIFIDAAAHVTEARMGDALRSVHRQVAELLILGSYPRADGVAEPVEARDSEAAYAEARRWYDRVLSRIG